jgi:hypothetical protein
MSACIHDVMKHTFLQVLDNLQRCPQVPLPTSAAGSRALLFDPQLSQHALCVVPRRGFCSQLLQT